MLYLVTYHITDYIPGAYDDFFEALREFVPRYYLLDTTLLVTSDFTTRDISHTLGGRMFETDFLYVLPVRAGELAGTLTLTLDRFLSTYKRPGFPWALGGEGKRPRDIFKKQ